jgi:hypothetical protein
MKKILLLLVVITVAHAAFAQDKSKSMNNMADKKFDLSIGLETALPLGDFKLDYNFAIGGSAKVAYNFNEQMAATLQAGYVVFEAKTFGGIKFPNTRLRPIKAGFRYMLPPQGFYVEPQLGISIGNGTSAFTYALNVGYMYNRMIDVSIRYENFDQYSEAAGFIGLRIAYNIPFGK